MTPVLLSPLYLIGVRDIFCQLRQIANKYSDDDGTDVALHKVA